MPTARQGSIHLFRFAGIDVYLHWFWFLIAIWEIQRRPGGYSSVVWSVIDYLALFVIVLLHEFGHALACRQVGGRADQILLWPFGGVAYVDPPPRPGATLWSIAAGPLVNVALAPLLYVIWQVGSSAGWADSMPDVYLLVRNVLLIDIGLLIFNILPVYPLDGGQILRSLLWFVLGRARSLLVATVIGLLGLASLIAFAVARRQVWLGAISVYLLLSCWGGLMHARALLKMAKLPRRNGYSCPTCNSAPPVGGYWKCGNCGQPFDTFASGAVCPNCRAQYPATQCLDCGRQHPLNEWASHTLVAPGL
jgi:Zn-dependent protease